MLKEKISAFIDKIKAIEGVSACALISRDGIIAGNFFDQDVNEPWFGALSATILASAESVGCITKMKHIESVTIRTQDTSVIVMGAGENFLITTIVRHKTDADDVHAELFAVAKHIGEVI
ncbi:MAG: roadblock/LC7 domain-containing protein [Methanomicrobiales archaeon]